MIKKILVMAILTSIYCTEYLLAEYCSYDEDCRENSVCIENSEGFRECMAGVRNKGESCDTFSPCKRGLVCAPTNQKCIEKNMECYSNNDCKHGLKCYCPITGIPRLLWVPPIEITKECKKGTCKLPVKPGDDCYRNPCQSPYICSDRDRYGESICRKPAGLSCKSSEECAAPTTKRTFDKIGNKAECENNKCCYKKGQLCGGIKTDSNTERDGCCAGLRCKNGVCKPGDDVSGLGDRCVYLNNCKPSSVRNSDTVYCRKFKTKAGKKNNTKDSKGLLTTNKYCCMDIQGLCTQDTHCCGWLKCKRKGEWGRSKDVGVCSY